MRTVLKLLCWFVFFCVSLDRFYSCVACFYCVVFSFFSTKPRDWLGRTYLKYSVVVTMVVLLVVFWPMMTTHAWFMWQVTDVAFAEDSSMFVTVGNRHVKFWYLDASKSKVLVIFYNSVTYLF